MAFPRSLKQLCTPAYLYFVLSMIALVVVFIQNIGNTNKLYLGSMKASVPNTTAIFIMKFIYILFWTWILNLICKDGYTSISWLLVLLPFILVTLIALLIMMK